MVQVGSAAPRCPWALAGPGHAAAFLSTSEENFCKSLRHYPSTLEVSPPPSAVTAAPCQPAVCWAIGVIDPARGEARQHCKGEDQGHLCSCILWEGRRTGCDAPLGPEKVPGGVHASLGSFVLHWAVLSHRCLTFPLCQIDFSSSMFVTIYTILLLHKVLVQSMIQNQ